MAIKHEDIASRFRAMHEEASRLASRQSKEAQSLVELCGGLTHSFGQAKHCWSSDHRSGMTRSGLMKTCRICGHGEWVSFTERAIGAGWSLDEIRRLEGC
jgi:hypothetical protein